jgi:4-hydroxybenzoate polyprenyltransferase
MFLGFIYNTLARFILFGDATILAITHFALPSFSSSLLLNQDIRSALLLSFFLFITFWFVTHTKNLKDTKEDKKRNYVTLTTKFKSGKFITKLLFDFYFLAMFIIYFVLNLTKKYLFVLLIIFTLRIFVERFKEDKKTVNITRLIMLLFLFGIIIDKTNNVKIILFSLSLCLIYVSILLRNRFVNILKLFKKTIKVVLPYATRQN